MKEEISSANLSRIFFERFFADWRKIKNEDFLDYLKVKIDQSLGWTDLESKLKSGKKLKIKFGIDPTGPNVHLGHLLPIMILNQFQKSGHQIDLIIGDFTARIGDPSGRNSERKALTLGQIKENMSSYKNQIGKFFNVKKSKIYFNSKWLSKISLKEMIEVFQNINVAEVLQREDFRKRIKEGQGLSLAEFLYSYVQAMDSVNLKSDVEVGGKDQLLNFAHARSIMAIYGQESEVALTTPVLEGIFGDGRKMSKSYGNYVAITTSLEDKFGKIMSIPDNLIVPYFKAFADIKESEVKHLEGLAASEPLEVKKQLAQFLVSIETKNIKTGEQERAKFERIFSQNKFDDIQTIKAGGENTFFDVIFSSNKFSSKSELLRVFQQGGVNLIEPEEKKIGEKDVVCSGVVRVGKKIFFRIVTD